MNLLSGHHLLQCWISKALGPALWQIPAPDNPQPWFFTLPTTFAGCRIPAGSWPTSQCTFCPGQDHYTQPLSPRFPAAGAVLPLTSCSLSPTESKHTHHLWMLLTQAHKPWMGHQPLIPSRAYSVLQVPELISAHERFPENHSAPRKKLIISSAAQQPLYLQGHFTLLFSRHLWSPCPTTRTHSLPVSNQTSGRGLALESQWEERNSRRKILFGCEFPQLPPVVPPQLHQLWSGHSWIDLTLI